MHFSNIDPLSGCFQVALKEESQKITAFIRLLGLYKWKRLPMGLASALRAFQSLEFKRSKCNIPKVVSASWADNI